MSGETQHNQSNSGGCGDRNEPTQGLTDGGQRRDLLHRQLTAAVPPQHRSVRSTGTSSWGVISTGARLRRSALHGLGKRFGHQLSALGVETVACTLASTCWVNPELRPCCSSDDPGEFGLDCFISENNSRRTFECPGENAVYCNQNPLSARPPNREKRFQREVQPGCVARLIFASFAPDVRTLSGLSSSEYLNPWLCRATPVHYGDADSGRRG